MPCTQPQDSGPQRCPGLKPRTPQELASLGIALVFEGAVIYQFLPTTTRILCNTTVASRSDEATVGTMDPLATSSLASNIAQLVAFGRKLVSTAVENSESCSTSGLPEQATDHPGAKHCKSYRWLMAIPHLYLRTLCL